ncbi:MFS transporter [Streptomyces sp. P6-2-1]|uniref:MFS transporter n=1 Tax=Streptomyces sp. P6-2-1 TaxID=3422591 RepID=UPI003D35EAC9
MWHLLLRNPAFRYRFAGSALSLLGDAVVPTALAIAVLRIDAAPSALALVLGCTMVPQLLALPLGGVLGDRLDPRTLTVCADLVRCLTQLVTGFELLGATPHLGVIAACGALRGVSSAFASPAQSPLLVAVVRTEDLHAANSLMGIVRSLAQLGGPGLAAALLALAGVPWAFFVDGLGFALSAVLLLFVRGVGRPQATAEREGLLRDLSAGWREVRARRWYWSSLIAHGLWNGAAALLAVLGPVLAVRDLGGEGTWLAVAQAGTAGLLCGALLAHRVRPGRPVLVVNLACASYGAPLALFATGAPTAWIIAAYGLSMVSLGFTNPVWETVLQRVVPREVLARVTSYDWLLSLGAMPLGYVLGPLLAGWWGPRVPLAGAAVVVAAACLGTALVPEVRGLRVPGFGGEPAPVRAPSLT